MAFNKERALTTAEKLVSKGKIEKAIGEYRKVLVKTGDDPNILNLVGDLYRRLRKSDEAISFWRRTAESYEQRGFLVKAIAVHKKIQRADPGNIDVHRALAELYHRQGLVNDARLHYHQLIEHYQRIGGAASVISVYQRLIELEPENPTPRAKLAELYKAQKLNSKAMEEYANIAAMMVSHHEFDQAVQVYIRALEIEPGDRPFVADAITTLRDGGDLEAASRVYERAVESAPGLRDLRSLLEVAEEEEPEEVEPMGGPAQLPGAHTGGFELIDTGAEAFDDFSSVESAPSLEETGLEVSADDLPAFEMSQPEVPHPEVPRPAAPEPTPTGFALSDGPGSAEQDDGLADFVIEFDDDEIPSSQVVPPPDLAMRAPGMTFDDPGSAPADHGALDLTQMGAGEFNYDEGDIEITLDEVAVPAAGDSDVISGGFRLGDDDEPFTLDEVALGPEPSGQTPEVPAPPSGVFEIGELDFDDVSISDSQVLPPPDFESPAAPADAQPTEASAREFAFEAVEDDAIEWIETEDRELDLPASAERPLEAPAPPPPVQPPVAVASSGASGAHAEIFDDVKRLSDLLAEAEVFVKYGLTDKAIERLEEVLSGDPSHLGAATQLIRLRLDRGEHENVTPLFNSLWGEVEESGAYEVWEELKTSLTAVGFRLDGERIVAAPGQELPDGDRFLEEVGVPSGDQPPVEAPVVASNELTGGLIDLAEMGSEIDAELSSEHEVLEISAGGSPNGEGVVEGKASDVPSGLSWLEPSADEPAASSKGSDLFEEEKPLFDLAAELREEAPPSEHISPVGPEEQSLEDIVEGFKKGVAENLSPEDSDTHYNLGIAYREMMLLDEAIGEFQIAAKDPHYLVDCCAMLGLCFREKGLPELAMKWYEKALVSSTISEDQHLGMLYEIGNTHMEQDDRDSAYRTFVEIYGMNTNYRDVASKMEELTTASTRS